MSILSGLLRRDVQQGCWGDDAIRVTGLLNGERALLELGVFDGGTVTSVADALKCAGCDPTDFDLGELSLVSRDVLIKRHGGWEPLELHSGNDRVLVKIPTEQRLNTSWRAENSGTNGA